MLLFDNHFPPDVTAFFSSSAADFSLTLFSHGLSPQQASTLNNQVGFALPSIFNIQQVHGAKVIVLPSPENSFTGPVPEADALVTQQDALPLCVRTADCLPVFFFDPVTRSVALAHTGWRGTQAGIDGSVVDVLQSGFGVVPADLLIGFGPCIRACCYEVGEDVAKSFPHTADQRQGRYFLNLAAENIRQLCELGVERSRILDSGECTCCSSAFFSYRREGAAAGRHLAVLMLGRVAN